MVNGFTGAAAAAAGAATGAGDAAVGVAALEAEADPPRRGEGVLGVEREATAGVVLDAAPKENPTSPPPMGLAVLGAPIRCAKLTPGAEVGVGDAAAESPNTTGAAAVGLPKAGAAAPNGEAAAELPKADPLIGVELKGAAAGAPKREVVGCLLGAASASAAPPPPPPPPMVRVGFSLTPADKSTFSTLTIKDLAPGAEFIM